MYIYIYIYKEYNTQCCRGHGETGTVIRGWWHCKLVQSFGKAIWQYLSRAIIYPSPLTQSFYFWESILRKYSQTWYSFHYLKQKKEKKKRSRRKQLRKFRDTRAHTSSRILNSCSKTIFTETFKSFGKWSCHYIQWKRNKIQPFTYINNHNHIQVPKSVPRKKGEEIHQHFKGWFFL